MWGTSSPDDKLVTDLAKATEAIKIAARRSDRLMAGKLSPLNFGLLQQYRHTAALADFSVMSAAGGSRHRTRMLIVRVWPEAVLSRVEMPQRNEPLILANPLCCPSG